MIENVPQVVDIEILSVADRRKLNEDNTTEIGAGVQITYDHTFEFKLAAENEISPMMLATKPFEQDESKENFVQDLKLDNEDAFFDLIGVSDVGVPETLAPSVFPTQSPSRPPSNFNPINANVQADIFSIGTLVGIGLGGAALVLILLLCYFQSRKRARDEGPPLGGYEPPGDELSYGWSTVFTERKL